MDGLHMKSIKALGSGLASTARAIWGRNDDAARLLRPSTSLLSETDLIEAREFELRAEQQRAEEQELARIANEAQRQLTAFEQLVGRSHGDATQFGEQLQQTASTMQIEGNTDMLASLIELTNNMICKTRNASDELRMRREEMQTLRGSLDEARKRADTDMLTQLGNRRAFEEALLLHLQRAKEDKTNLALAICDIDHFKSINDRFGHQTGDGVLKLVAKILNEHCARDGLIFRIGGEEFAVLFPDLSSEKAAQIIDAARADLHTRRIRRRGTGEFVGHVSFSAGIAETLVAANIDHRALFADADRELYLAKNAGRNRTCLANTIAKEG
jgi:diguanylate cyclase